MAWGRSSMMLSSDSVAPRGLPGRFTMSLSFLYSLGAHQLGKTRDILFHNGVGGLRSNVTRPKPGAPGSENGVTIIAIGPGQQRRPNPLLIVRQDLERLNQPASLFQYFANRRARAVLPSGAGRGVAQHEDFCAKHEAVSRQLSGVSKKCMHFC